MSERSQYQCGTPITIGDTVTFVHSETTRKDFWDALFKLKRIRTDLDPFYHAKKPCEYHFTLVLVGIQADHISYNGTYGVGDIGVCPCRVRLIKSVSSNPFRNSVIAVTQNIEVSHDD